MSHTRSRTGIITGGSVLAVAAGLAVLVASAVPAAAQTYGGNVSVSWSVPGAPSAGLTNVSFPITVSPATVHAAGTYFAQQFNFTNAGTGGYTGLQPRANLNGRERLRGVFSSFQSGATTTDPNCHAGADGGPGVSCGYEFDAVYGHTYTLTVARTGTDTWTGTATDTVSGVATHIGTWRNPANSGNLNAAHSGFVEYYSAPEDCSKLARIDVVFGGPTSTDGNLTGGTRANYEYGNCTGRANYRSEAAGNGTRVTRGWIGGGTPTPTAAPGAIVRNTGSGRCLDDPAGNTTNGTRMEIWDCTGAANQKWTATAANALTIGGKCLDANGGGTSPGTSVILYSCHGGTNQRWTFQADGSLRGVGSGLCVAPSGGGTGNGTFVVLATCDGQAIQRWTRD
ncbi:RICIN domain-containing protein [Longispora urticae]